MNARAAAARGRRPQPPKSWWDRMRHGLRTDPRVRTLAFTLAVASVLWAKPMGLLLWARIKILTNIPRTAIADPDAEVSVLVRTRPELADPQELRLPDRPATDPFRIDPARFPLPERLEPVSRLSPKRPDVPADDIPPEVARRRQLAELAAKFRLTAAGSGIEIAVLDGRTFRVGQSIEAADGTRFRLVGIHGEGVVLECEGMSFDLDITRPNRGRNQPGRHED